MVAPSTIPEGNSMTDRDVFGMTPSDHALVLEQARVADDPNEVIMTGVLGEMRECGHRHKSDDPYLEMCELQQRVLQVWWRRFPFLVWHGLLMTYEIPHKCIFCNFHEEVSRYGGTQHHE